MGGNRYTTKTKSVNQFNVGVYIRLSLEDQEDKAESNSITSQKETISQYLKKKEDLFVYDYYIDDGYSGTNFNRPSFQRLLLDLENKKINTILVKDLSRFGRNFLEVGNFFENIFPLYNVRFISLIENIDSYERPASLNNLIIPFKNFINDEFSKDLSKKVYSVKHSKMNKGIFIGGFTPYGYKKDPQQIGHLIIDEEPAKVVRLIYKLYIEGYGYTKIVRKLMELKIKTPTDYKTEVSKYVNPCYSERNKGIWNIRSVKEILSNETYIGTVIQAKEKKINYKTRKCVKKSEDEWIKVPNMHEPIISKEDFQKVQSIIKEKNENIKQVRFQENIFKSILKCADCGSHMIRKYTGHRKSNPEILNYTYYCSKHILLGNNACSLHKFRGEELEEMVLEAIKLHIDMLINIEKTIESSTYNKKLENEYYKNIYYVKKLEKDLQNEKNKKRAMYENWKNGIIPKEEFKKLSLEINDKVESINKEIKENNDYFEKLKEKNINSEWIENIKKYKNITELNTTIIQDLIERIDVYENQQIKIKFKFQDEFNKIVEETEKMKVNDM